MRLRAPLASDHTASAAMWADLNVVRHIGTGTPSTRQQSWMRLLNYAGHWALLDFGYWVVEERTTGNFVGEVGFADFKRDLDPAIAGVPESGWVLASAMHGKGYASEACRAMHGWADARGWERTVCIIATENAASIRVAQRCGYVALRPLLLGGVDALLYARVRPGAASA